MLDVPLPCLIPRVYIYNIYTHHQPWISIDFLLPGLMLVWFPEIISGCFPLHQLGFGGNTTGVQPELEAGFSPFAAWQSLDFNGTSCTHTNHTTQHSIHHTHSLTCQLPSQHCQRAISLGPTGSLALWAPPRPDRMSETILEIYVR